MQIYIVAALVLASFGIGYYIGGRGLDGVKIDLDNTKNEIEKVKTLVSKTKPKAITIVTPVGGGQATPAGAFSTTTGI